MTPKAYGKLTSALKKNPGGLHRRLHIPRNKKIPAAELARARHSRSKIERKEAVLATTAKHFKH